MAILTQSLLEGSLSTALPLFGWVLRATIVLAFAGLATVIMRRNSAALRHLVWTVAFGGVLLLPGMGAMLPAWRTPAISMPRIWTDLAMRETSDNERAAQSVTEKAPVGMTTIDGETHAPSSGAHERATCESEKQAAGTYSDAGTPAGSGPIAGGAAPPAGEITPIAPRGRSIPWPVVAFAIWILGTTALLAWFLAGHVAVRRLTRGATPVLGAGWQLLAADAARRVGHHGRFELRVSDASLLPMTWGLLRPHVLMPSVAESWPLERRRLVLMHELAHVRRRDCLTQALAQVACALLWFHPVVWYAAKRMRIERERACDDQVLAADTLASTYADHLLEVVRSLKAPRFATPGAVSFASPSQIEGRLLAVLHPSIDRRRVGAATAGRVLALAALLAWPLATLAPANAGAPIDGHAVGMEDKTLSEELVVLDAPEDGALGERLDWVRDDASRARHGEYWVGYRIEANEHSQGGVLGDTEGIDLSTLSDSYEGPRLGDVLPGKTPPAAAKHTGPVAILLHMKGSKPDVDRVRFQSFRLAADLRGDPLYWVGEAPDQESVDLLRRLRTKSSDEQIAKGLLEATAMHRNSKIVLPELKSVLERSSSDDMRAQAVEGLGRHPARESVELLKRLARTDPSFDVRRQAAEALGEIGTAEALDALVDIARSSSDEEVRRAAVEGLGGALSKHDAPPVAPTPPTPATATDWEQPAQPPQPYEPPQPLRTQPPGAPAPYANGHSGLLTPAPSARLMTPATPQPAVSAKEFDERQIEVQRQAVESLGRLPEDVSLPKLLEILEENPNRTVRLQAVESIVRIGSSAALALVQKFAWQHEDEAVRSEAVESLGQNLQPGEALSQLSEIAEMHPDEVTRQRAVESIGHLEAPGVTRLLKSIVADDPSDKVQRQAVESIGHRSEEGTLEWLAETARSHPSRRVRSEAVDAIGRFDSAEAAGVLEELIKAKNKKSKF